MRDPRYKRRAEGKAEDEQEQLQQGQEQLKQDQEQLKQDQAQENA